MKNIKKLIFVLVLSVVGLVLFGCTVNESQGVFKDSKDVIAFQAISGVELLAVVEEEKAMAGPMSNLVDELAVKEEIDAVNRYLGIMEKYLGTNNGLAILEEVSDLEQYDKLMVIKTVDMSGAELEYRLYYNEIIVVEDEEEDEIDDQEEPEINEEEQEYLIEGILVVNEVEYIVEGFREFEENEETLMLMAKIDDDNFVVIHYEIEEEERVFNYLVKKDGVVTRTKVEVEENDDEIKVELTFVEGDAKGKYKFEITTDEDGTEIIKVKYVLRVNDEKIEKGYIHIYITKDEETGDPIYDYKIYGEGNDLKHEFRMNRNGHHGKTPEDFKNGNNNGNKTGEQDGNKKGGNNGGINTQKNNGGNKA